MSTFRPSNRSEMCPSCGTYRSAIFIPAMILMRLVIAGCRCLGGLLRSRSTPSIRYLTASERSNGSTWMSLARSRTASRMIRLTRLISVGSWAIRCTSAASTAWRFAERSSPASSPPPSRAAIWAAVAPKPDRSITSKTACVTPTRRTGRCARIETSSAATRSAGSTIARETPPSPSSWSANGTARRRTACSAVSRAAALGSISGGASSGPSCGSAAWAGSRPSSSTPAPFSTTAAPVPCPCERRPLPPRAGPATAAAYPSPFCPRLPCVIARPCTLVASRRCRFSAAVDAGGAFPA